MTAPPRKVIVYISMSVDGYLSTLDDDISWLSAVEEEGEDYGYAEFTRGVDTYVVGRKTYDVIREMLHGDFPQARQFDCYVITRQERPAADGVTFYSGPIEDLIQQIRREPAGHIYCDGGGEIVRLLMERDLIDEYVISVIPILLGDGKRLFLGGTPRIPLRALPSRHFPSGLVQLRYVRE
ncbi:dihydrofolate reductase family protein [Neolewinella litorea]|uniref:Dihydrofolate reductase n=1 Tax=Neolewinella litorea TaxID=2562452 RepID=A0A4S4NAV8_9BACT|nr:dihydrofolate reductase family protein [Neolewinella litorea]THH36419.1 dihydrofolate reductase [Neolewinella litorea]